MSFSKLFLLLVVSISLAGLTAACERKEGPAEKAGKQIDEAVEQMQDEWDKTKKQAADQYDELNKQANEMQKEAGRQMEEAGKELQKNTGN